MQTLSAQDSGGPGLVIDKNTTGVLEGADGVAYCLVAGRPIAWIQSPRLFKDWAPVDLPGEPLRVRMWLGDLYWEHVAALMQLQGMTPIQQFQRHFMLLMGRHRPACHPSPSVSGALLAEFDNAWSEDHQLSTIFLAMQRAISF